MCGDPFDVLLYHLYLMLMQQTIIWRPLEMFIQKGGFKITQNSSKWGQCLARNPLQY